MIQDNQQHISSAGLTINTKTGEVSNSNQKRRLSPVNSRVLNTLLHAAETTVTRQQLFDRVWPNQIISDDALTRSISDLRAQLKELTTLSPLIETIPKVGYRWLATIEAQDKTANTQYTKTSELKRRSFWSENLKPMLLALALLSAMFWALLGWLYFSSKSNAIALIVLPTEYNQTASLHTNEVKASDCLKQAILKHDDIQYLSTHALRTHNGSPFPYYSYEFGVRWFIESKVSKNGKLKNLSLNLVDAKTALVAYSQQYPFNSPSELADHCQSFIAFVAEL